jgi:hypothetical protein
LNSTEDAKFRLDEHRCRLLRFGYLIVLKTFFNVI